MLGVISYLPSEPDLRATRIAMIERALENNRKLFRDEDMKVVVAQNFTPEELKMYEGFEIIEAEPLGAAKARNIILDKFEASEEPFLWLMDDDVTFYDYYGFSKLIKEFKHNEALRKVDIITFFDPRMSGFRPILDNLDVKNYLYFIKQCSMNTSTAAFLIRNSRQAGKKPIRFIENYRELKIREDIAFLLDNIKAGKIINTCPEIIYKWDNSDKGTIEQNKSSQKWIFELEANALERGLAKMYGLTFNESTKNLEFDAYRKRLRRQSKAFKVERIYKLDDEDIKFARERVYGKSTKRLMRAIEERRYLLKKKEASDENSDVNALLDVRE